MCKKKVEKQVLLKRYVCQLCVAPKTRKHTPCYVFLIQIIEGNCIFSNSLAKLANMVQDQKVDKHTPPQPWGACMASIYLLHLYLSYGQSRVVFISIQS